MCTNNEVKKITKGNSRRIEIHSLCDWILEIQRLALVLHPSAVGFLVTVRIGVKFPAFLEALQFAHALLVFAAPLARGQHVLPHRAVNTGAFLLVFASDATHAHEVFHIIKIASSLDDIFLPIVTDKAPETSTSFPDASRYALASLLVRIAARVVRRAGLVIQDSATNPLTGGIVCHNCPTFACFIVDSKLISQGDGEKAPSRATLIGCVFGWNPRIFSLGVKKMAADDVVGFAGVTRVDVNASSDIVFQIVQIPIQR